MMSIYIAFKFNQKQITLQGDADILPAFFESLSISSMTAQAARATDAATAQAARATDAAPRGKEGVKHVIEN